jgi:hypothetical protein
LVVASGWVCVHGEVDGRHDDGVGVVEVGEGLGKETVQFVFGDQAELDLRAAPPGRRLEAGRPGAGLAGTSCASSPSAGTEEPLQHLITYGRLPSAAGATGYWDSVGYPLLSRSRAWRREPSVQIGDGHRAAMVNGLITAVRLP